MCWKERLGLVALHTCTNTRGSQARGAKHLEVIGCKGSLSRQHISKYLSQPHIGKYQYVVVVSIYLAPYVCYAVMIHEEEEALHAVMVCCQSLEIKARSLALVSRSVGQHCKGQRINSR